MSRYTRITVRDPVDNKPRCVAYDTVEHRIVAGRGEVRMNAYQIDIECERLEVATYYQGATTP